MHIGYGEIVRGSTEAVRMVGYSIGHADDCIECFVWTQTVLGRGYDMLRLADTQRPHNGWPSPSGGFALEPESVNLDGLPLFAYAARLADLVGTSARAGKGLGSIAAYGLFGGWAAPYVVTRAARGGCVAAAFWHPGEKPLPGDAPASFFAAMPAGSNLAGPLYVTPRAAFGVEAGTEPPAFLPAEFAARVRTALAERSGRRALIVLAANPQYAGAKLNPTEFAAAAGWPKPADTDRGTLDAQARLQQVIDQGYDTDDDNHKFFVGLLNRIRLPNTERSANQAG